MRDKSYCPRCGTIISKEFGKECFCGHKLFDINPKWNITDEKQEEIRKAIDYGEKTREEAIAEWKEYCRPFIEEFVMHHPDFDMWSYEHQEEIQQEWREKTDAEFRRDRELQNQKSTTQSRSSYSPTITCPYCKSTNTKKISSMSRMFSGGLFGLGSKKIGKQWHCNSCGSDF